MLTNKKEPKNSYKVAIVSPEDVDKSGWYTFSLNPAEQYEYESTPIGRWNKCYQEIQSLISILAGYAKIEGELEISRTGRVHLHGYIKYIDVAGFYLTLPKVLRSCQIEIDTIADLETWNKYVHKSAAVFDSKYNTVMKQDRNVLPKNQFLKNITQLSMDSV